MNICQSTYPIALLFFVRRTILSNFHSRKSVASKYMHAEIVVQCSACIIVNIAFYLCAYFAGYEIKG